MELHDYEVDAIVDAATEAALHAWIGNMPRNPYEDGTQASEVWDHAFRSAFYRENH